MRTAVPATSATVPAAASAQPATEPWELVDAHVGSGPQRAGWSAVAVAVAVAAVGAIAYLIAAPPAADLAAATYRAGLFSRVGFSLWDNAWYGGHSLLGYSLLSPALGALLGVRVLLALSVVLAAWFFAAIVQDVFARGAAIAAATVFALGLVGEMLAGRVTYALGLAIALGALLALQRRHAALALPLAAASSLASPLAGAFLALAGIAIALACGRARRRGAIALAASALAPIALFALAFPEGGSEPFAASSFWPALAAVIVFGLVLPRGWRALRIGVALYAVALIAAFAVQTPVGGNAVRLGALLAAPLLVGVLWGRRVLLLAVLAPVLLYWQLETPVGDLVKVLGDPSVNASYYRPLRAELEQLTAGAPTRVEIPMTGAHWESQLLAGGAGGLSLARGWERQLDTRYAALFYDPHLSAAGYHGWLQQNAVAYVALPDVRLDESAQQEAALITRGLPYLREVWRSRRWRLFAVSGARPLATPPARLAALGTQGFTLDAPSPGAYEVRVRFTPYWSLIGGHGCVLEAPGGFTEVRAAAAGSVRVGIAFTLARIFDHAARCH
jgi:hypothetical protein